MFCTKVSKKRMIFSGFTVTIDFRIRLKTNSIIIIIKIIIIIIIIIKTFIDKIQE